MSVAERIEGKLRALDPLHLEVLDESRAHNVPRDSESHFRVTVVCEAFAGRGALARHRMVNELLADELAGPVHALALHAKTPDEWFEDPRSRESPPCLGGSGTAG